MLSELTSAVVREGDIILLRTPGIVYSLARSAVSHEYDHAVVVVPGGKVVHVSPPKVSLLSLKRVLEPRRRPLVLRPNLSGEQMRAFIDCILGIVGQPYGTREMMALVGRLVVSEFRGSRPPPAASHQSHVANETKERKWICTDAIADALSRSSDEFRAAFADANLDAAAAGSVSLSDFLRIARSPGELLSVVATAPVQHSNGLNHSKPASMERRTSDALRQIAKIMIHGIVRADSIFQETMDATWTRLAHSHSYRLRDAWVAISPRKKQRDLVLEDRLKTAAFVLSLLLVIRQGRKLANTFVSIFRLMFLKWAALKLLDAYAGSSSAARPRSKL